MRNIRINKAQKKKFYYLREDIVTDLEIVNKLFSIIEHLKSQKDLKLQKENIGVKNRF